MNVFVKIYTIFIIYVIKYKIQKLVHKIKDVILKL